MYNVSEKQLKMKNLNTGMVLMFTVPFKQTNGQSHTDFHTPLDVQPQVLSAKQGANGYHFYSLWSDPTGDKVIKEEKL